jgi:hypothetical protein
MSGLTAAEERRLTDKQKRFIAEYPIDWNGLRAVKQCGYRGNDKSLTVRADQLKHHPLVKKALDAIRKDTDLNCEIRRSDVIKELNGCLKRNSKMLFDEHGILMMNHSVVSGKIKGRTIHDLPDEVTCSVDGVKQKVKQYTIEDQEYLEVETELKLSSKTAAIDMAMKHIGAYAPDKLDVRQATVDLTTLARPPLDKANLIEQEIKNISKKE